MEPTWGRRGAEGDGFCLWHMDTPGSVLAMRALPHLSQVWLQARTHNVGIQTQMSAGRHVGPRASPCAPVHTRAHTDTGVGSCAHTRFSPLPLASVLMHLSHRFWVQASAPGPVRASC